MDSGLGSPATHRLSTALATDQLTAVVTASLRRRRSLDDLVASSALDDRVD